MKKITALLLFAALSPAFALDGIPVKKVVPVSHVFAPNGFDSNDNSEIIITGYLPNLCHKSPAAEVKIEGKKIDIKLTSLYYHESNPFCPEMIVPFTESVTLGVLDRGNYEVVVNGKSQWEHKEKVKIAGAVSNSIDEFSYAYVHYIEKEDAQKGYVKLKGYNPSDCFELESIEYIHNGKDTYSILPKMKQVRGFCPRKMVPFEYEWKVPNDLDRDEVLLHVRTLDGKSVNSLYYR